MTNYLEKSVNYFVALDSAGFPEQCLGNHLGKCCCFMDVERMTTMPKITWLEREGRGGTQYPDS